MMSTSTRHLQVLSADFIALFGLSKPEKGAGNNEPRIFPYGTDVNTLCNTFIQVLDTRENYLHFLDTYKDLIFDLEETIIDTRIELAGINRYGDPYFTRRYLQQKAKLLGNLAHKLYYIRTNARAWRREVNELLADSLVGAEA